MGTTFLFQTRASMTEKASRSGKKKTKAPVAKGSSFAIRTLVIIAIAAGLTGYMVTRTTALPSVTGVDHPNKLKFPDFRSFFPFYLTEHADGVNRLLHVVGTTITLTLVLLSDVRYLLSMLSSLVVGLLVRELTIGLPHGFVEFGAMVGTFLLLNRVVLGKWGAHILAIGYLFAWLGHFFFEHNQPATFIYPSFSLMGDFYMFYGVATRSIPVELPKFF